MVEQPDVHFESVTNETVEHWRRVHNEIIPISPLSTADVLDRMGRNRLQVALRRDEVVGCSTVRPPVDDSRTATVIVRVLPAYRRQGIGSAFYEHELAAARAMGADVIETVILETNADGLRFALDRGFVEIDRYMLDGDEIAFVDLRLT
jgi:GNAT superfamily N-acetyltransferase